MADYLTRQAQRVVDRITADAVAAATRAYGKTLPLHIQQGVEVALGDLLPGLEAEQRQEEADFQAEQAKRMAAANASWGTSVSCAVSGVLDGVSYGGTEPG